MASAFTFPAVNHHLLSHRLSLRPHSEHLCTPHHRLSGPVSPPHRRATSSRLPVSAVAPPSAPSTTTSDEDALSGELLRLTQGSTPSTRAKREHRQRVVEVILSLERLFQRRTADDAAADDGRRRRDHSTHGGQAAAPPPPYDSWSGTYSVVYVRMPRPVRRATLRTRLGRLLFKTRYLFFHHVLERDRVVVNMIQFRLLGVLPGALTLRGRFRHEPAPSPSNTISVDFEAPRLTLARGLNVVVGAPSSVTLTTTYSSPTMRIGRGKRGSIFVFLRGVAQPATAAEANAWRVHLAQKPLTRVMAVGAAILLGVGVGVMGWIIGMRVAAVLAALLVLAGYTILRSGGTEHAGDLEDTGAVEGIGY